MRFRLLIFVLIFFSNLALAQKPNIIVILTDDQRYDVLSLYDTFPWLNTPHLDRLAQEGAHFKNAFVTTAVCSPSRASFLTGTYANRHGVIVNAYKDPDPAVPLFPELLQQLGYVTAFIGKWHMDSDIEPRKGFDHWVNFPGQGNYFDNVLNVDGSIETVSQYITDELTDRALRFIDKFCDVPFALYLSHKAIHAPFTPAPRHTGLYSQVDFAGFDDPAEDLSRKPNWLIARSKVLRNGAGPDPDKRLEMIKTVSAVDDSVGRIVGELERLGLLDSTAIVFAADNGYLYGEHGSLGDKRNAYEESIRIPLIMRYPPLIKSGTEIDELVLNIDVAPTLLALAGLGAPPHVQGESWLRLFRGEEEWRDSFLYEYYREDDYRPRGGSKTTPTILAIRTAGWKYISYPELEGEIDELYRLDVDPKELNNLAGRPEFATKLEEMRLRLAQHLTPERYTKPKPPSKGPLCVWLDINC
ncbi:MAG: sulfatase [Halioglobus sp.]|nr:sulfatase [Halioglobus sp.]